MLLLLLVLVLVLVPGISGVVNDGIVMNGRVTGVVEAVRAVVARMHGMHGLQLRVAARVGARYDRGVVCGRLCGDNYWEVVLQRGSEGCLRVDSDSNRGPAQIEEFRISGSNLQRLDGTI